MHILKNFIFRGRQIRLILFNGNKSYYNNSAVALHRTTNIARHHHPHNAADESALCSQFQFRQLVTSSTNPLQSAAPTDVEGRAVEDENEVTNDGGEQMQRKTQMADDAANQNDINKIEEQEEEEREGMVHQLLATTQMRLAGNRKLWVNFKQGRTGHRYFQITMLPGEARINFAKIAVPEDAYAFLQAMDLLIRALPDTPPPPQSKSADGEEQQPIFASQTIGGKHYDYVLHIALGGPRGGIPGWQFCMRTVQTVQAHKPRQLYFPLSAMPVLRDWMADALSEHDGTQQIGPRPSLPMWAMQPGGSHQKSRRGKLERSGKSMSHMREEMNGI